MTKTDKQDFPTRKIKELVKINYGKGLAERIRDPKGSLPVYGSNGIIGYHSKTITKSPVIIVGRKGSAGEVNLCKQPCWPIDTSFYIDEFPKDLEPNWLFYYLKSLQLSIHANGPKPGIKRDILYDTLIPFPLLKEQNRIVVHIEKLTSRAEEIRQISVVRKEGLDTLLQVTYANLIKDVDWRPLKEVATQVRRGIKTKPNKKYEEMGVRSFGKGTFKKPVLTGAQIGNKRIYEIHEGDLVFNNVFAWEKAIAVAQKEDHGRVGSHRFITYVPHENKATSEFLCNHFLSKKGIQDIRAASPGSAGRNRTLGLKKLEIIQVPVPDYDEQVRFSKLVKRRNLIRKESTLVEEELNVFVASLIAKAFRGEL